MDAGAIPASSILTIPQRCGILVCHKNIKEVILEAPEIVDGDFGDNWFQFLPGR